MSPSLAWAIGLPSALIVCALAFPISILAHELGHAVVARELGYRVYAIVVGKGETVWSTWWGGARWELQWGWGGHLRVARPGLDGWRWRSVLVSLGGPLVSLLIGGIGLSTVPMALPPWPTAVIGVVTALNLSVGLVSFLPSSLARGDTDGQNILTTLRANEATGRAWAMRRLAREAGEHQQAGRTAEALRSVRDILALDPGNFACNFKVGITCLAGGAFAEARLHFQRAWWACPADGPGQPEARRYTCNGLAWADLRLRDPAFLPEALGAARAAIEAGGDEDAVVLDTLGEALVRTGEAEAGLPLLRKAYLLSEGSPTKERAYTALSLALGHLALGERGEALRWRAEAVRLDPGHPEIGDLDQRLAGTRAEAPAEPRVHP